MTQRAAAGPRAEPVRKAEHRRPGQVAASTLCVIRSDWLDCHGAPGQPQDANTVLPRQGVPAALRAYVPS